MKLIITGALGHLGSFFLAEFLKTKKFSKIILIDNLITYRYCSLFHILNPKNNKIIFINRDVTNFNFNKILKKNDIILHLAAITNAAESFKIRKKITFNNYNATKNIAKYCIKKNTKLIYISSTSVYGSADKIMYEDNKRNTLKPQSPYAVCKIKEENFLKKLYKKKKLKLIIFRFGTIFGISKGMRFHTAVNKFCWQSSIGESITVWRSSFNQKRPYLDIKDAFRVIIFVIKKNIFDGEIYNVATCNTTVKKILDIISKFSKKNKITFTSNKIMNQLSYEVNCEKIMKHGFKYKGNISKQIKSTLNLLKI